MTPEHKNTDTDILPRVVGTSIGVACSRPDRLFFKSSRRVSGDPADRAGGRCAATHKQTKAPAHKEDHPPLSGLDHLALAMIGALIGLTAFVAVTQPF
ncbi:hypothetical protein Q4578_16705 [Shimia thalassica]|uniref:hypothetical protein n=1 Tax=Shimia thalassica TaxID=1715693 RepID=UPI0026E14037|nr:hypothetical protein [Shimia thalassica]MDO6523239.1 hypothetical protein [Shimia thalassica]